MKADKANFELTLCPRHPQRPLYAFPSYILQRTKRLLAPYLNMTNLTELIHKQCLFC